MTINSDPPLLDGFTPREVEVLDLLAAGYSNQEIARTLYVSVPAVERHLTNAFRRLLPETFEGNRRVRAALVWLRHTGRLAPGSLPPARD